MPELQDQPPPFLRLVGIGKRYGGVVALDGVDFTSVRGSIHAVLGENGAGKSTLIKVIAGAVRPDDGRIEIDGREVSFADPLDANSHGFVCVFQELSLIPDLSVADNICITHPPGHAGFIARRAQRRRAEELLTRVGCQDIDPGMAVRELPLSRRQLVELAKALGRKPRLLIMDEATSALTADDVQTVYAILREMKQQGVSILFISHRMHEVEALADTCSVFRSGRHIETFQQGSRTESEIVNLMIGREITQTYPPKPSPVAESVPVALEVRDLAWTNRLQGISLAVRRGEILGLGGLDGQGQREVLLCLFGVLKDVHGIVTVDGDTVSFGGPVEAMSGKLRLALVPEDRKTEGLLLPLSVGDNLSLASLNQLRVGITLDRGKERRLIADAIKRLRIGTASPTVAVGTLSGGNQQKVVLGKWLATRPDILLLMDPTRGIDVGTKQEIYVLMRQMADLGVTILFYSTDYDELIGMCDRVAILYGGRLAAELRGADITEANIVAVSLAMDISPSRGEAEA